MADFVMAARLETAQQRFVDWLSALTSNGRDAALQLWCRVNATIESNRALSNLSVQANSAQELDASYDRVEYGVAPYAFNLVKPVLVGIGVGLIAALLAESAVVGALVTLVVFCVLLLRQGGSMAQISTWIDQKLSGLKLF